MMKKSFIFGLSLLIIFCSVSAFSQPKIAEAAFLPQGVLDFFARIGLIHTQPINSSLPPTTMPDKNPGSDNSIPPSPVLNRTTYSNNYYGFSVKIPIGWQSYERDASNKFNPYITGHVNSVFTNIVFTPTDITTKAAESALPTDNISISVSPQKYIDQSIKNINDYWNSIDTSKIKRGVGSGGRQGILPKPFSR